MVGKRRSIVKRESIIGLPVLMEKMEKSWV